MKHKLLLTIAIILLVINDTLAQPSLPGNDGGGNVTDSPIHFLIPLALAFGAFIGIKKLKSENN
jgi:hypothetical protein